jgi:hypothetical protein
MLPDTRAEENYPVKPVEVWESLSPDVANRVTVMLVQIAEEFISKNRSDDPQSPSTEQA